MVLRAARPAACKGQRYPFGNMLWMLVLGIACGHSGFRPQKKLMEVNRAFYPSEPALPHGLPSRVGIR